MRCKLVFLAFFLAVAMGAIRAQAEPVCWQCESCSATECHNCVQIICPI